MKWLINLLPANVLGALTPFLNPWVWVALLGASSAAFLFATHLASQRFEAYQSAVEATGRAQKVIVRYITRHSVLIDKETVNALKQEKARLKRDNAALLHSLREHASRSFLPPNAPPPAGDQGGSGDRDVADGPNTVCFDRRKLDEGLRAGFQRFIERYGPSLERGDRAYAALQACVDWTEKQHALNPTGELTPQE